MKKDTFYFSHDYNARNDPKILELRSEFGMEGYGIYWSIIETLAEDNKGRIIASLIGGLSVGYGIPKDRLSKMIDLMVKIGLLHQDEHGFYSKRMDEYKIQRKLYSDKGKEGALKRWGNSPPKSPPNTKERKVKENINNNAFDEFYEIYPKKVAKSVALKSWGKLTDKEHEIIMQKLPNWINHKPFEGYNYPNPATFLNQRRWEDDLFEPKKTETQQPMYR